LWEYFFQPAIGWRIVAGLILAIFCRRLVIDLAEDHFFDAIEPWVNKYLEDPRHPFHRSYRSMAISEMFSAKTAGGFKIGYEVEVISNRIIHLYFKRAGLTSSIAQRALVRDFNREIILPLFAERQYCFGLELQRGGRNGGSKNDFTLFGKPASRVSVATEAPFRATIIRRTEVDGKIETTEIADATLRAEVAEKEPFREHGCDVRLNALRHDIMTDELVEENYAMLDENDKQEVESDGRFIVAEAKIVVAVLKRRLDFLGRQSNQKHDADMFSIETEKVGRSVRIRWKFKSGIREGYELVGFRRTGGFFANQFDMQQNGPMVAQSRGDGEAMELLEEGEANFYTFFLRALHAGEDGSVLVYSPLRFRLLVSTRDETEAIEGLLRRFHELREPAPENERIARALKEVRSYVEFDTAFETMRKTLEGEIDRKSYSDVEKNEKIARLRDVMASLREKYEE
jgi:hypothetical protein